MISVMTDLQLPS